MPKGQAAGVAVRLTAGVLAVAVTLLSPPPPMIATPPPPVPVEPSDAAVMSMRFAPEPRPTITRASRTRVNAPASTPRPSRGTIRRLGFEMNAARGWGEHWGSLDRLWMAESGWNPNAVNRSSGACGIMQRHPCNGYTDFSVRVQIRIGLDYIAARYGNPTKAFGHFTSQGWY